MNYEEQVVSLLLGLLVLEGGKVWQLWLKICNRVGIDLFERLRVEVLFLYWIQYNLGLKDTGLVEILACKDIDQFKQIRMFAFNEMLNCLVIFKIKDISW